MADYGDAKRGIGSLYPEFAIDGEPFSRVEPLITPEQLKSRFLFGIPLVSAQVNPNTGLRDEMTDEMINDIIIGAVNAAEIKLRISIFPVQRRERQEFDYHYFQSYMHFRTEHSPIMSVDSLSIETANNTTIYTTPEEWIETGGFIKGQVNIVPLAVALPAASYFPNPLTSNQVYLGGMHGRGWVPYFWTMVYTTGFEHGRMPRILNDMIGAIAATEILGQLGATRSENSSSLGIDGLSQSVSTVGPQVYLSRIEALQGKIEETVKKLKNIFGRSNFALDV
jgi:hypothetical protein